MIKITSELFNSLNWADALSEEERTRVALDLTRQIEIDEQSRADWLKSTEEWTNLAMQVKEQKSFPWNNSSNIKYPLLTTSSMQFHARAQQALLRGNKPLKAKVLGRDPTGQKTERAKRIEEFMGYVLLHQITDWEDEIDRLLMVLPITGTAYKKIYWSTSRDAPRTELVLPAELILNYNATDFERARRTHVMTRFHNEIVELQRGGYFVDVDLGRPPEEGDGEVSPEERVLYESHCWLDLDDDGYEEPYIVVIDKETTQLLRISPRYNFNTIAYGAGGEVLKIPAIEFFTRYVFLPSPDSKLYGMGMGTLLGPTNMAVNTLINQLVDAGTLSVMPSGFLGRGVRLARGGNFRFAPGEWKTLQSTGDDLRKGVYPLPVKEPSAVLFSLLGTLVESGQQIGSVADIMLGENPGQNQPFSTTQAVLEQGMKVFVGIYKRVYRSLSKEYRMLMEVLSEYAPEEYMEFHDQQINLREDFAAKGLDVVPVSDPDMVSEQQRLLKGESLLMKLTNGLPLNPTEVTKRMLEAEDHENIEALMQVPPQKPDPEHVFKMAKLEADVKLRYAELQMEMPESQMNTFKDYAQAMLNLTKAEDIGNSRALEASRDASNAYLGSEKNKIERTKAEKPNAPSGASNS